MLHNRQVHNQFIYRKPQASLQYIIMNLFKVNNKDIKITSFNLVSLPLREPSKFIPRLMSIRRWGWGVGGRFNC